MDPNRMLSNIEGYIGCTDDSKVGSTKDEINSTKESNTYQRVVKYRNMSSVYTLYVQMTDKSEEQGQSQEVRKSIQSTKDKIKVLSSSKGNSKKKWNGKEDLDTFFGNLGMKDRKRYGPMDTLEEVQQK